MHFQLDQPVDPAHSWVVLSYSASSASPKSGTITARLDPSGQYVHVERYASMASEIVELSWTLIERSDLLVVRGSIPARQLEYAAPIDPPVAVNRSVPLFTHAQDGDIFNVDDTLLAMLDGGDRIVFRRAFLGNYTWERTDWQVVSIAASATVQHGIERMPSGTLAMNILLPNAVAMDRSFLLFNHEDLRLGVTALGAPYGISGQIADSLHIHVERRAGQVDSDIAWSVVTWDALQAQHGWQDFASGTREHVVSLSSPIDVNRAVAFCPGLLREGTGDYAADDIQGEAWFSTHLGDNGTTLIIRRASARGSARIAWTVLDWP